MQTCQQVATGLDNSIFLENIKSGHKAAKTSIMIKQAKAE